LAGASPWWGDRPSGLASHCARSAAAALAGAVLLMWEAPTC
jgi:hypothetical protein